MVPLAPAQWPVPGRCWCLGPINLAPAQCSESFPDGAGVITPDLLTCHEAGAHAQARAAFHGGQLYPPLGGT
eukprot:COSAG01_NODE_4504_length_4970_cov_4.822008_2_plen_72_part_00